LWGKVIIIIEFFCDNEVCKNLYDHISPESCAKFHKGFGFGYAGDIVYFVIQDMSHVLVIARSDSDKQGVGARDIVTFRHLRYGLERFYNSL
jgi:hypothetical protein